MSDTAFLTAERFFFGLMIYSILGWVYECILESFRQKKPINRGFLNGPYCPIYGFGSMMDVTLLGGIENPVVLFSTSAILTCVLEYLTSVVLEKMFNLKWWDYSDFKFNIFGKSINVGKFNIQGRVCLVGAVAFGTLSILLVYVVHPATTYLMNAMPMTLFHIVCAAMLLCITIDLTITLCGFIGFNDKLAQLQVNLDKAKAGVIGIRENVAGNMAGLKENVAGNMAGIKENMVGIKDNIGSRVTDSAAYEKMSAVYTRFAESLSSQQVRIIDSFPQLKSIKYEKLTVEMRKYLKRRKKRK